jgi:hypothetical protein
VKVKVSYVFWLFLFFLREFWFWRKDEIKLLWSQEGQECYEELPSDETDEDL